MEMVIMVLGALMILIGLGAWLIISYLRLAAMIAEEGGSEEAASTAPSDDEKKAMLGGDGPTAMPQQPVQQVFGDSSSEMSGPTLGIPTAMGEAEGGGFDPDISALLQTSGEAESSDSEDAKNLLSKKSGTKAEQKARLEAHKESINAKLHEALRPEDKDSGVTTQPEDNEFSHESQAEKTMVKTLSLFSGAGGLDLGFQRAGFDTCAYVELKEWACETLHLNYPDAIVIGPPDYDGDVRSLGEKELRVILGENYNQIEAIVGGPPCKTFSSAAKQRFLKSDENYKQKGFNDEENGSLVWEFFRILEIIKPKMFLIENVPELKTDEKNKPEFEKLLRHIRKLDYKVVSQILKAPQFGVPQNRERLFVVGWRGDAFPTLPLPTHGAEQVDLGGRPLLTQTNVALALTPDVAELPNHILRAHKDESIVRYKTLKFGQREKKGRVDRLDPNEPSKTVIAGGDKGGGRSHLHPFEARTLSPRECARLQTFPDSYVFSESGNVGRLFTQVGNAVPPLLAEVIGRHLIETLFGLEPSTEEPTLRIDFPEEITQKELCSDLLSRSNSEMLYNDVEGANQLIQENVARSSLPTSPV